MIRQGLYIYNGGARLLTSMVKWSERMVSSQMCQHQAFVHIECRLPRAPKFVLWIFERDPGSAIKTEQPLISGDATHHGFGHKE